MPDARDDAATLVFDLDGTILSENSFRIWVAHMIGGRLPGMPPWRRAALALGALRVVAARKAGLISHETAKWRLQRRWQDATRGDGGAGEDALVGRLCSVVRPELVPLLAAVADGRFDAVLATAAVADYAEALGRLLGFRHVLATPRLREEGTPGTVGVRKRDAVLAFLAGRGWLDRPFLLFTDHVDDLPLILRARRIYWFGPEEERRALARRLPDVALLPGHRGGDLLANHVTGTGSRC